MNIKQNLLCKDLRFIEHNLNKLFYIDNDVYKELNNFLMGSSKRIRSILTLLYLKAYGINNIKNEIYDILISGELIHNASLLHDDVLDDAQIRRGETTISNKFSPKISILLGDYLVSYAIDRLLNVKNNSIIRNFQDCIKMMSRAEINQYLSRGKYLNQDEYISICKGKTASLFVAIIKSAFLIEGIEHSRIENFANNFGILFQLKNDNDKNSAENDKKNRIYTLKNIIGIEKTNILIDNYQSSLRREINNLQDSVYKQALEELLDNL